MALIARSLALVLPVKKLEESFVESSGTASSTVRQNVIAERSPAVSGPWLLDGLFYRVTLRSQAGAVPTFLVQWGLALTLYRSGVPVWFANAAGETPRANFAAEIKNLTLSADFSTPIPVLAGEPLELEVTVSAYLTQVGGSEEPGHNLEVKKALGTLLYSVEDGEQPGPVLQE